MNYTLSTTFYFECLWSESCWRYVIWEAEETSHTPSWNMYILRRAIILRWRPDFDPSCLHGFSYNKLWFDGRWDDVAHSFVSANGSGVGDPVGVFVGFEGKRKQQHSIWVFVLYNKERNCLCIKIIRIKSNQRTDVGDPGGVFVAFKGKSKQAA